MRIEALIVVVGSRSEGSDRGYGSFGVVGECFLLFYDTRSDYNSAISGKNMNVPKEIDEVEDILGSLEELSKGRRLLTTLRKDSPHSFQDTGLRIRCLQITSLDLVIEVAKWMQPDLHPSLTIHTHHPWGNLVISKKTEESLEGYECFLVGI